MKKIIRAIFPLLAISGLILVTQLSCKKSNNNNPAPQTIAMETGIYEGTLNNFQTGQNLTKFQVSVTKTGDNTYQVSQVGSGGVPSFTMLDKNHNYPFINFTIASQTYQGTNFSGSGQVSGGFDALFNTTTKSLYFAIAISSNLSKEIVFSGYKQ